MRSEELSEALAEQRRLDVARQRMLDTTAKQLTLAADPLGGAHQNTNQSPSCEPITASR